jgi:hypothetical protein
MGIDKLSTVYGRIVIDGKLDEAKRIINSFDFGDSYPYIQKEMFNTGWSDNPWQYESQIIGFSVCYKRVEEHWSSFIIKFETLIEKLEYFDSALINLETFYYGTYNFKWLKTDKFITDITGKERVEWDLQIGHDGDFENYESKIQEGKIFNIGLTYPIDYSKPIQKMVQDLIQTKNGNKKVYLNDHLESSILNSNELDNILTFLEINDNLRCGYENGKGKWIIP